MITRRRRTRSGSSEDNEKTTQVETSSRSQTKYSAPQVDMTTCRDRTTEFVSAVKSLQSRQGKNFPLTRADQRPNGLQHRSEFFLIAKHIGKDISNTFAKLEKLAILARKKSLFDDRPVEIQELTYIIKQDIASLTKQVTQLQELVKSQRSSQGKHLQNHSNTVVLSLENKLQRMSKDFKNVLETRTQNMKQQKERREKFSQGGMVDGLPSAAMPGPSVLQAAGARSGDAVIDMGLHNDDHMQLVQQEEYIQSRSTAMESIESTIVELGTIFSQLAHMVKEQEETIQRIDSNVENTEMNVEAAHGEILKYFQSVTSNRWLIIKIFCVLIVFFVIFVVFMA